MDDMEDDARYPLQRYSVNKRSAYNSSIGTRQPNRNPSYPANNNYREEMHIEYDDDGADIESDEEILESDDQENDGDDEEDDESGYHRVIGPKHESGRRQKKLRLDNSVSNYEFAPRVASKPSYVARSSPADWTEHATHVLLEAWGDRFLQLGRKSLRSEDWLEVAEKVSDESKEERTDVQCRNRLDTLKKKYKKEKTKMEDMRDYTSKWIFFKKMDMLLNSPKEQSGLACGVDSGEYVFMNSKVYLNRSNGLDEMRDSPGEGSESSEDDDSDGLPPRRREFGGGEDSDSSFRLLADSIQKFGEIYEKIENNKRQQMVELEMMRIDFQRDLEVQKEQILERAQAEIAKLRQEDDVETDGSTENLSG